MQKHQITQYNMNIGRAFKLLKPLGPMRRGEIVSCFAEEKDYIWLFLPRDWCGARQVKLSKKLARELLEDTY